MGLASKIKNALHSDEHPQDSHGSQHPPGAFPSDSATTANTKHNTGSHTTGGYSGGTTGATGATGTHAGAHTGSHTAGNTTTTGYDDPDGVHGPHGKRTLNKADPRVDSDRDHRGAPGAGITGSNTYGTSTGPGHAGGLSSNTHGGATGGLAGNHTTGYDDPDGVHGPHGGRAANKLDPRVDSDRDHRAAPGAGMTGAHRPTDSGVDLGHGPGHNRPYPGENVRNAQDPYWGDVGRDGRGATGAHGTHGTTGNTLNKDLPLRPNESSVGRTGPQAVGGGTYNAADTHHHDPASSVDRSMEGRDFTHPHQGGNSGVGAAGSDPYGGVHGAAHNPQAALAGGNSSDPYDTRIRDRDMGRDRTGHGAALAAGQAAHKHHRDDMHESVHGTGSTGVGGPNSGLGHSNASHGVSNTHGGVGGGIGSGVGGVGGVNDHSRSSLTGDEPGVPRTSMLDPYNEAPTSGLRGNVSGGKGGHYGGRNGSPPFNQGTHNSNVPGTTGLGSGSMGPDHYGPGHEGAKVFHTCTRCGEDNDISRYFKKDAVYRMG
ncbi:hypothetical protein LX36DRAFT_324457 [Colletotrichum falcatum]|nr:hypothetical protein LX36DRAFT_324457 [Colletotrichum falcatum]